MLAGALYFTTSTIESSILNMIPAITYILSLITSQEKLEIHTLWGKGKILGTLLSVSGALTLMLWRGSAEQLMYTNLKNWLIGLAMVIVGVFSFSAWILMLEPVTKQYPAELSMTAIMFFFATLQTCVLAGLLSHKASQWQLKWDLELLNIFIGWPCQFLRCMVCKIERAGFCIFFLSSGALIHHNPGIRVPWPYYTHWKVRSVGNLYSSMVMCILGYANHSVAP
ncbi:hypothetical protein ACLOJK_011878 [Asimina triloba]